MCKQNVDCEGHACKLKTYKKDPDWFATGEPTSRFGDSIESLKEEKQGIESLDRITNVC